MKSRANKKLELFQNYKSIHLIKYMKCIIKKAKQVPFQTLKNSEKTPGFKIRQTKESDTRLKLFRELINIFYLQRAYRKKHIEAHEIKTQARKEMHTKSKGNLALNRTSFSSKKSRTE